MEKLTFKKKIFINASQSPRFTMADTPLVCISCKKKIANDTSTTRFKCPKCGKYEIIRCGHCRSIVAKYKCPECGFIGPN